MFDFKTPTMELKSQTAGRKNQTSEFGTPTIELKSPRAGKETQTLDLKNPMFGTN